MDIDIAINSIGIMCHLRAAFPYLFSVWISVDWCKWDIKALHYFRVKGQFYFDDCYHFLKY